MQFGLPELKRRVQMWAGTVAQKLNAKVNPGKHLNYELATLSFLWESDNSYRSTESCSVQK